MERKSQFSHSIESINQLNGLLLGRFLVLVLYISISYYIVDVVDIILVPFPFSSFQILFSFASMSYHLTPLDTPLPRGNPLPLVAPPLGIPVVPLPPLAIPEVDAPALPPLARPAAAPPLRLDGPGVTGVGSPKYLFVDVDVEPEVFDNMVEGTGFSMNDVSVVLLSRIN